MSAAVKIGRYMGVDLLTLFSRWGKKLRNFAIHCLKKIIIYADFNCCVVQWINYFDIYEVADWSITRILSWEFRSNINFIGVGYKNKSYMYKLNGSWRTFLRVEQVICLLLLLLAQEFQSSMRFQTAAWKPTRIVLCDVMCSANEKWKKWKKFRSSKKLSTNSEKAFDEAFNINIFYIFCITIHTEIKSPKIFEIFVTVVNELPKSLSGITSETCNNKAFLYHVILDLLLSVSPSIGQNLACRLLLFWLAVLSVKKHWLHLAMPNQHRALKLMKPKKCNKRKTE